jgi:hypothetical protein
MNVVISPGSVSPTVLRLRLSLVRLRIAAQPKKSNTNADGLLRIDSWMSYGARRQATNKRPERQRSMERGLKPSENLLIWILCTDICGHIVQRCLAKPSKEELQSRRHRPLSIRSSMKCAPVQVFRGHARAGAYHNERSTACLR